MLSKVRFPALLFFGASFLGLLLLFYLIDGKRWLLGSAALGYGLLLGFTVQALVATPLPLVRVAVASFAGSIMLWLPVVLVTYGIALAAAPVFAAYAAAVVLGTVAALRLRTRVPPA